jgi:8-oxo-dGTP diphosphatase
MSFTYEYARPALTADCLLIALIDGRRHVLLIERGHDPFAGRWALPGGFVDDGEDLETAARRELLEETGLEVGPLKQFGTWGTPGRDPRGWVVSVVFVGDVDASALSPTAGDDASEVAWHPLDELPHLAFDHGDVLAVLRG